jgi:hypothetical protein
MLVLIDNNFADRDGMRDYLAASRSNLAALPGTVFEEWFKARSPDTTRRVQQIACAYPAQIVVLKDTRDLLHMGGKTSGLLLRLIDRKQTRDFAPYCATVVNAPMTADLEAHFHTHRDNVQETLTGLLPEAHKMMRLFASWDEEFSASQKAEMRGIIESDRKLSPEMQYATFEKAVKLGGSLFTAHKVDRGKVPATIPEMANLLAFRYGAMAVALYIRLRNSPGTAVSSDKKVLNHLMDVKIAAQATYFDGFMTHEADLHDTYRIAVSLISALGGYTHCGKGLPIAS